MQIRPTSFSRPKSVTPTAAARPVLHAANLAVESLEIRVLLSTYVVTTVADSGAGSLRDAILQANAHAGADAITFDLAGAGPHTIAVLNALPTITDTLAIQGPTETAGAPAPQVVLSGGHVEGPADGLHFTSSNNRVYGLTINGFRGAGIHLDGVGGNGVEGGNGIFGCFLGTDAAGTLSVPNGVGISINASNNNIVGAAPTSVDRLHTTVLNRNVISGNTKQGIYLDLNGANNVIHFNRIGTDVSGTAAVGNGDAGVHLGGEFGATVDDNLISGNAADGVFVTFNQNNALEIARNRIGTNAAGDAALGNGSGISLVYTFGDNNIRNNLISGNASTGIHAGFLGAATIQGNDIGTNASGTAAVPNGGDGIIYDTTTGLIGGHNPGDGNLISGNLGNGIQVTLNSRLVVQGNWIGLGSVAALASPGVPTGPVRFVVKGLGNGKDGVLIDQAEAQTLVGGDNGTYGNRIAHNGKNGVEILNGLTGGENPGGSALLSNSIYANGQLGIDLNGDGPTPNDPAANLDADAGANGLQNFPVIASAAATGNAPGSTAVQASLDSAANTTYFVQFFASVTGDPSGFGEGQMFLGGVAATTGPGGHADFSFTYAHALPAGWVVTATATDPRGNTSEFSGATPVTSRFQGNLGTFGSLVAQLEIGGFADVSSLLDLRSFPGLFVG